MDNSLQRNAAIDMFRGLTMFFMIIVNDFWKIHNVPHWLEHFAVMEDGMGLSDVIYPMFLFAMGMSIPYALDRRAARGCSTGSTVRHILSRTLALLVMGVFFVNSESGVSSVIGYGSGIYWLLMLVGFFLVWGVYPKGSKAANPLRICGIAVLLFLIVTYRGPEGGYFHAGWWGILGQIGWMYLFCAGAYLLCANRRWILPIVWAALCLVNLSVAPMRDGGQLLGTNIAADFVAALNLGNAHSAILALGGMLLILAERATAAWRRPLAVSTALCAAALSALTGALVHIGWITSKGLGTLPWVFFSIAISIVVYTLLRILERFRLTGWFKPLRPCGTSTLTVYMIPYIFMILWVFINPVIPEWNSGWTGVGMSVLLGVVCVGIAWILEKAQIKLKI